MRIYFKRSELKSKYNLTSIGIDSENNTTYETNIDLNIRVIKTLVISIDLECKVD